MNQPRIWMDEQYGHLYIMWGTRGVYHLLTPDTPTLEVYELPANTTDLNPESVWQEAFDCGREEGYDAGFDAGYDQGFHDGQLHTGGGW